ncbi:hypothetical protein Vadar_011280 [Vaccinium darrowii]|uniref:Uncharacterized protein n=1 Tax=Vaccinium darrowii TaxID=229202 RepID=A0ACB7XYF7_9ERIC|nr:hypothetical protein Vadar_011280 [Vaccinium darrowii]
MGSHFSDPTPAAGDSNRPSLILEPLAYEMDQVGLDPHTHNQGKQLDHCSPKMDVSGVTAIGSNRVDSVDIDDENEPILVKDEDENEPQKKKPKNKNASLVWDHFSKGQKVGDKQKSTCNYCGTEFTSNTNQNGTSSMRTHILIRCKVYEFSEFNLKKNKGDKRQTTLGFEPVGVGGKYNEKREVESKIVEIKDGMKRLYNWYEKRSMEDGQAPNVIESSRNKDKKGKRRLDLCEAMDSEFLQHMEEETNMVSKSELESGFGSVGGFMCHRVMSIGDEIGAIVGCWLPTMLLPCWDFAIVGKWNWMLLPCLDLKKEIDDYLVPY